MKKIVITGGHLTPALAVADILKRKGWRIYWLGEKFAVEGEKAQTLEHKTIPALGIPFYHITTAKFHRKFVLRSFFSLWKLGVGFFQSLILLVRIRPQIILSFGSYVSVPPAAAAWVLRIPVILHEQTAASGLANRIISKLAKKIALSFPESLGYFPRNKTVITGNIVRESIFKIGQERLGRKRNETPVLYITGGSRGSQIINRQVIAILPKLLPRFVIYHQTGFIDFEKIKSVRDKLPPSIQKNYSIAPLYGTGEVEKIYKDADLAISRSGANTVSELAICAIPSILIPIPWSEENEQEKNAKLLAERGAGILLPQKNLSRTTLLRAVEEMWGSIYKFRANARKAKELVPQNAARKLFALIQKSV
ncbi:MAG: undecaprenyldiphospho-muramoylpentapeptide beta-N-acetylglucosaminyltransferase [Candidatus Blackburnbacteria bacterium]|nr:undecaprenyldiphospho-muramoylpentapeptide beta-N-acetylglucosaminyltransferase [Candidatus Blackburnbacteria bacterium]